MTRSERQLRYAYLVTLLGVVLATVTTAYTAVRSFLFGQAFGARPSFNQENFTRTQFGNFTGAHQFGNINPNGGFTNYLMLLAVIIAIVGVLWLGLSLKHSSRDA
ncbi:MAG: hypothetical protein WB661_01915 [Candidatus Bathyarchaeia archaeon]